MYEPRGVEVRAYRDDVVIDMVGVTAGSVGVVCP